jgi:lysophospholipase L1-like esterase
MTAMQRSTHHLLLPLTAITAVLAWLTYLRVIHEQLNLATGVLFLSATMATLLLVCEVGFRIRGTTLDRRVNVRLLLAVIAVLAIAFECVARLVPHDHKGYAEANGASEYYSAYKPSFRSWFHVLPPYFEHRETKVEFDYFRRTNSLGLAEREIPLAKMPGEYRVIALGDSYTEGVGTGYDSSWVRAAERHLARAYPTRTVTVMNAGIAGSDPFFEYVLLRDRLIAYVPDLVIVCVNNSDVSDVAIRGGMERFRSDGSTVFSGSAPWWEWIYAINYTVRHVVHDLLKYDHLFMTQQQRATARQRAVERLSSLVDAFHQLSSAEGFALLLVTHPHEWEVRLNRYLEGLDDLVTHLEHQDHVHFLDLLDYYLADNIITSDNASEFYWTTDAHHNGKGYYEMGKGIAEGIIDLELIGARAVDHASNQ